MLKDHETLNELLGEFFTEVRKPDGTTSCIIERLSHVVLRFENQYNLSYCYNVVSMLEV